MPVKLQKYFVVVMVFIIIPYFIDQIDGFINLVLMQKMPLSKLYKTPMLLYAIGYTLYYDRQKKYSAVLLFILFLIVAGIVFNVLNLYLQFGDVTTDAGYMLKIFTLPILYFYFAVFHSRNPLPDHSFMKKLFLFLFFAFGLAILFSTFGFGIPFYGITEEGESIGQQGYFAAGNEISGMYLLFASIFYYYIFRSRSVIYMFIGFGLGVGVGVLMSSKTAIASAIICFLGNYFLVKNYDRKMLVINKVDASLIMTFVGLILLTILFINPIIDFTEPIIGHFRYRYRMSGDVIRFLTSGRLDRAEAVLANFSNNYSIPHMLFGKGYTFTNTLDIRNSRYAKAEMDFPDILSIAGVIGVLTIYAFWLYIWVHIYKKYRLRENELAIPCVMALAILIINSNISGHILYSGLINPPLAYLAVFILKKGRQPAVNDPVRLQEHQLAAAL